MGLRYGGGMGPYEPLLVIIAIGKMSKSGSWIIGKDFVMNSHNHTCTTVQPILNNLD
eukprot:COSAG05_NODE_10867_length_542_cov_0.650113_2_plen_57_part_00